MVNVSRVITSSRLGSQRIIVHRTQAGWVNGEFVAGPITRLAFTGIITVAQPKDLQMIPEGDRLTGAMRFLTREELHQTRDEGISDVIVWRGQKYKILTVSPDIDYGFYRSIGVRLEEDDSNGID